MHAALPIAPSLIARLFAQSNAARWTLSVERFQAAIDASVAHAFTGATPDSREIERYVASLHVEDLALAAACASGDESAWDHFVREHRPGLYRAADAIDPTGGARELADSLYADLFGLEERQGVRRSLFRYFHGRSRLSTWLRAVLSQRHVDRLRAGRRLDPLPDDDTAIGAPSGAEAPDPERPRLVAAIHGALASVVAALAPRDRLRLGSYYVQDLTLAAIGRLLNEHEATVSRHLTRTRGVIRRAVEQKLRGEHGFDEPTIAACFRAVLDDPGSLDLTDLVGAVADRKHTSQDRSKG